MYLPPTVDFPDDSISRLREALDTRDDIVAAYWLKTVILDADDSPGEHALHFELRDPPGAGGAPMELFREISGILPPLGAEGVGIGYTFPPADRLPGVRRAGTRVN